MAVTLVHAPPLIILDEPTVGVDPLLRETIWKHLMGLVSTKRTTVIVTTHYIEEAAHSDTVGVMRGGRLLTEKSPTDLYAEYQTMSLQDVVLRLCHDDETSVETLPGRERSKSSGNIMTMVIASELEVISAKNKKAEKQTEEFCFNPEAVWRSLTRIKSLSVKNFYVMMRNLM
jgi:ABC-type multidrug transport system ATPase subunit